MTKQKVAEEKAEQLILPILREFQLTLVDTEYVKEAGAYYLRIYIDKEGGVTIDDCEKVSRAFSPLLDEDEFIEEAYTLEISSPGLGRPLKKDKDYDRNLEKMIEIRLFTPVEKRKDFTGILKRYDKESVTLDEEGTEFTFPRKSISLIREYVDWNA